MKKLLAFAFAVALGMSTVAAQAMPIVPHEASSGVIIKIAGGCGPGWHRGPYGHCRPNGWRGPRYLGPGPGPCYGRGWHRACNGYGRCWRVCN